MNGHGVIENEAIFKISYGLFLLAARDDSGDNACIVNTVQLLTDTPKKILFSVNKKNKTHDMILATKQVCASILTEETPFSVFEHFGMQSGHTVRKFSSPEDLNATRAANGVFYLPAYTNAYIAADVDVHVDCGTHTLFIATVCEAKKLSDAPSATYEYYFKNIKPKPEKKKKKGFVCKVCGYVYEGDTLPPDFVCPLCNHGADDFEPL